MAVVGHGPGIVLALLVAVVVAAPAGVVAVGLASWASWARWGTAWLSGIGGAQAVLGIGLVVGPASETVSGVLAAAAIVLAVPPVSWMGALAVGSSAAFLVAGPVGASGSLARVLATLVCGGVALGIGLLPWRRAFMVAAVVAGFGALALG
jgi:hypothetical protein